MRNLLCEKCARKHGPSGTRQVRGRSPIGEPAEIQRLIFGTAKQSTRDQRKIQIGHAVEELPLDFYNCDTCNEAIRPGELCACWSVWTENMEPVRPWEDEYIVTA